MRTESAPRRFEPFHFGEAGRRLFGIYHAPDEANRHATGLVLCHPFGQEYLRSHRSFRQLAIRAALAGFPVLRFDYHGCGDSMGRREEGSVAQWLNDVSAGIEEIRRRARSPSVCLVGLRLGAWLAMRAAAARTDVAGLVMWDPIHDGQAYLDELARAQPRRGNGLAPDGPDGDEPGEVQGFPLTAELAAEFRQIALAAVQRPLASHILVIDGRQEAGSTVMSEALVRLGARVETRHVPGPPLWTQDQTPLVSNPILQSILAWVVEWLP